MGPTLLLYKIVNRLRRALSRRVAAEMLRRPEIAFRVPPVCNGLPLFQLVPGSRLEFGANVYLNNEAAYNPIGVSHPCVFGTWSAASRITIGDNVGISGASIFAKEQVTIGSNVLIGADALLMDTDLHALDYMQRRDEVRDWQPGIHVAARPLVIGDDVFIGARAIILKGSRIGRGCTIGAGAVVSGTFPAFTLVAGNPATIVRRLAANEDQAQVRL